MAICVFWIHQAIWIDVAYYEVNVIVYYAVIDFFCADWNLSLKNWMFGEDCFKNVSYVFLCGFVEPRCNQTIPYKRAKIRAT